MKTQKQILEEMEEGCGKKLQQSPFVETAERCGEEWNFKSIFCISCQSKISASKERWKEEMEFLENLNNISPFKPTTRDLVETRIAELKEMLK